MNNYARYTLKRQTGNLEIDKTHTSREQTNKHTIKYNAVKMMEYWRNKGVRHNNDVNLMNIHM